MGNTASKVSNKNETGECQNSNIENNTQDGGKFLGKGAYGCVYNPPIPCKGSTERRSDEYISKVMVRREASKEMRESEVIREIDPDSEFALFGLDICPLDTVTVSEEGCLEDCDHLVDFVSKPDKEGNCKVSRLSQLIMKNGGYSLDYKSSKNLFKIDPVNLLKPMYDIFVGIDKIKKAGYLHRDIKNPNLVYNEKLNKIYLIDFGLMEKIDETFATDLDWNHEHDYPWYPPDWNYIFNMNQLITSFTKNRWRNKKIPGKLSEFIFYLGENWNKPQNNFDDDIGPIVKYYDEEIATYQENILKTLKKYFGEDFHNLFIEYLSWEDKKDLKEITEDEYFNYLEDDFIKNLNKCIQQIAKHIKANKTEIKESIDYEKTLSASTLDTWATAKIMLHILDCNENMPENDVFKSENRKVLDFANLLVKLSPLSLIERQDSDLNDVLMEMKTIINKVDVEEPIRVDTEEDVTDEPLDDEDLDFETAKYFDTEDDEIIEDNPLETKSSELNYFSTKGGSLSEQSLGMVGRA